MKLAQYGCIERTTRAYCLKVAQLKETLMQSIIRNDSTENLIRLVNVTTGTVDEINGINDLIMRDMPSDIEIHVLRATKIHLSDIDKDVIVIVFDEDADDSNLWL